MLKLRSLKFKLACLFGINLIVCITTLTLAAYFITSKTLTNESYATMSAVAAQGSKAVESRIQGVVSTLETIAHVDRVQHFEAQPEAAMRTLQNEAKRSGHLRMGVGDVRGDIAYTDGARSNLFQEESYKRALSGDNVVGGPAINIMSNNMIITYYVPVRDDDNKVIGILTASQDGNTLSDLVSDIKLGEAGFAAIVNSQGSIIAHPNKEYVLQAFNPIVEAETYPRLEHLAKITHDMIRGQAVNSSYMLNNERKILASQPMPKLGWTMFVVNKEKDVLAEAHQLRKTLFQICIIAVFISSIMNLLLAGRISRPLVRASRHLNGMAAGDFTQPINRKLLGLSDETGELFRSMRTMQDSLQALLLKVYQESVLVHSMLREVAANIQVLNREMNNISTATRNISAGMEEYAASTEEMNDMLHDLEKAAESVTAKTRSNRHAIQESLHLFDNTDDPASASHEAAVDMNGLLVSIRGMVSSIDAMARTANHCTPYTAAIAKKTSNCSALSRKMVSLTEETMNKSRDLADSVAQFKL